MLLSCVVFSIVVNVVTCLIQCCVYVYTQCLLVTGSIQSFAVTVVILRRYVNYRRSWDTWVEMLIRLMDCNSQMDIPTAVTMSGLIVYVTSEVFGLFSEVVPNTGLDV